LEGTIFFVYIISPLGIIDDGTLRVGNKESKDGIHDAEYEKERRVKMAESETPISV